MSEYADRDTIAMSDVYGKHVSAMTAEGLHAKSDIAAELAHRDIRIADLERQLAEAQIRMVATVLAGTNELGNIAPVQLDVNGNVILCDRQFNALMTAIAASPSDPQ